MRKVWIICGWVVIIAGIVLIVAMGLALAGGAEIFGILPAVIMAGLFAFTGQNFIIRGKRLPLYTASEESEEAAKDRVQARLMISQAIRIGGIIVLVVAVIVGLLIYFSASLK